MWISRFRVTSFSSFRDSGWVDLDPSFNLFIGQNNSGKTALLRAIAHPLPNNRHKDSANFRGAQLQSSLVEFDIRTSVGEVMEKLSAMGEQADFPAGDGSRNWQSALERFVTDRESAITLEIERRAGNDASGRSGASLAEFRSVGNQVTLRAQDANGTITFPHRGGANDNLPRVFGSSESGNVFHFDAQRLNVGVSGLDTPERLHSNARNLPAVLANLQGARRPIFDTVEKHVLQVLGGIERITVAPRPNGFEILVWPERESLYEELAFSLESSGTGVGQLLAILTAVVTSEQSVIVIDEINSFLHPSAVKKLLSLLRSDYPHHQYIISTHSADAIAGCNAERLYIVERKGFDSSVRPIRLEDAAHAREVAGTLGFSMMDVFGYDRMVWVEGPTEEVCFPYLVRKFDIDVASGLGFSSVSSASALTEGRRDRAIVEIYERAGKQLSPLLRGMAFALDRERLSDEEVLKQERSKRKLRLLPRRCLECYLLHPAAIVHTISELSGGTVDGSLVEEHLKKGSEKGFGAAKYWKDDIFDPDWQKHVDAPRLLNHVFTETTEQRIEYRKTRDAITLLRWVAENEADSLAELLTYLERVLEVASRDTAP